MMRLDKKMRKVGQVVPAKRLRQRPRTRSAVKKTLVEAFRVVFPHDTVDISDGYMDNIHILVVSRKFDKMTDRQRQRMMWSVMDGTNLGKDEKHLISLLYSVSPAEIK